MERRTDCPANTVELRGAAYLAYHSQDPEVLMEGRAGTGKSIGWLTKFHHAALTWAGARIALTRDTRKSMDQSTLVTFEEQVLGATHPLVVNGPTRANREEYVYPNRSVIVPVGLDDPGKLFSTEWDIIFVNELAQGVTLDAWELFNRALRNNKLPYQQLAADCNPGPPAHWANKRARVCPDYVRDAGTPGAYRRLQAYNREKHGGAMTRLVSVHQDNPRYFDMQSWDWTLDGRAYLLRLGAMTGHRRQRMLMGRWVAAEGSVFPEFDEARHVIETLPAGIDAWPHFLAMDPGFDHPCAILWLAIGPNGCYYVVDEIYQGGLSVEQHAAEVMRHNREHPGRTVHCYYGDPQHAFSCTAQSVVPIASQFKKATGIGMTPWPPSKDKESMVNAVRARLVGDPTLGPKLKVYRKCEHTIAEFQTWRYKRTAKGELPPGDDQYEDANNHALDCICGMVAMNLRHDRKGAHIIRPE